MFIRENNISIILDHWTSSQTKSFIGLVAFWINESFDFNVKLLDFKEQSNHEALFTSTMVDDILEDFAITDSVGGVVGDATNSMISAINLIVGNTNRRMHLCTNHVFQRAMVVSYENVGAISESIQRIKRIVKFIKNSPKFLSLLCDTVVNGVRGSSPVIMNKTRWNSLKLMLDSVKDQLYMINSALILYKRNFHHDQNVQALPSFNEFDFHFIQVISPVLAYFNDWNLLWQENTTSISYLIPSYNDIHRDIHNWNYADLCPEVQQFCNYLWNQFGERITRHYKENNSWKNQYIIAAFLSASSIVSLRRDPNFTDYENIFKTFVESIQPQQPQQPQQESTAQPQNGRRRLSGTDQEEVVNDVKKELNDYLKEQISNCKEPVDDLKWWKDHSSLYPTLATLARKYLAIPISSASVETLFCNR